MKIIEIKKLGSKTEIEKNRKTKKSKNKTKIKLIIK